MIPWNGSVPASGFILDEALIGRAELLRRVLGAWSDRARLGRSGTRWYLLGITARQVDSRACAGAPLVLNEGRWLMGAVKPEGVRATPIDAILECVGGELRTSSYASLTAVHPSELIELELPAVLEVEILAPPPQPVVVRRVEAPTLEAVFAPMLANLAARDGSHRTEPAFPPRPPTPSLRARLGAWLTARARRPRLPGPSLGARLRSWFAGLRRPALPPRVGRHERNERNELDVRRIRQPAPRPSAPSWLDRLSGWFSSGISASGTAPAQPHEPGWLDRLGQWLTPAAPAIPPRDPPPRPKPPAEPGWLASAFRRLFAQPPTLDKQREYLEDLRRRFDLGDLSEALRRAIPLGGAGGLSGGLTSLPARRDTLSLLTPNAVVHSSMVMPNDEYALMRKLYRDSADALVARGQIEEAAYVLAKLLNDGAAAVALLEKHCKLELAAHLATAQHLPEVDRIRLWLLAGRKDEAIRIARGSNDFGTLVAALSTRAPELARQLRSVWGDFLAQRQRFTEAIVVTAPLPEEPEGWSTWLSSSLQAGGAAAATALAVDVSRHPDHVQQSRALITELLAADDRTRLTTSTAEAFLKHAPSAGGPLYRDLWRRLMRGASSGHRVDRFLAERVLKATGDQTLVTDAVTSAPMAEGRVREPLELAAPVVPTLPVLDVAPLPKGRRVLAHGAAGLRIVSSNGETLRHLLVKADLLVAGPVGIGVLVLSLDGELTRCWKLDPLTLELKSWFQGRLGVVSRRYDGLCWAVSMENALVFLDPAAEGPMEWWRVPNVEIRQVDASGSRVIALGTELGLRESWRYVFNAGTERLQIRYGPEMDCWARGDTALPFELRLREDGLMGLKFGTGKGLTLPSSAPWVSFPMDAGLVLVRVIEGDSEVRLAPWSEAEPYVVARLSGTIAVRCRDLAPDRLALCDEHGRVTELDLN